MAIADIASRLYQSSAYRNTPVLKALKDSAKMNLKFRFSLVGMAASLTGSQALYQIAQQKYLVSDAEKKQESEDQNFKKNVIMSMSALQRQVALLESIAEKNSFMINTIMNDLGYFKGQRKINSMGSLQMNAFRVPIRAKTVKGRIDEINAELQALKDIRMEPARRARIQERREAVKAERDRNKALIAATVAGVLGALGLKAVGASGAVSLLGGAGLAGAAALASSAVMQQAIKKAIGSVIPIVGKAFKLSLAFKIGMDVYERQRRRVQEGVGVQTGSPDDYRNTFDPVKQPNEWNLRNQEISLRKSMDQLLESAVAPIDDAVTFIGGFLTAKYGLEIADYARKKGLGRGRGGRRGAAGILRDVFVGGGTAAAASTVARGAATSSMGVIGGVAAAAAAGAGAIGSRRAAGAVAGNRVWTGTMWKTLPPPPPVPRSLAEAPRSVRVRRYVPLTVKRSLLKMQRWSRGLTGAAARTGIVGASFLGVTILNMIQTTTKYENGSIDYNEYKNEMTQGWKQIVDTVGITGVSAALGTMVGGPAGFVVGAAAGVGASFLLDDASTWMAEKLFAIIHEGEAPPSETAGGTTITPEVRANYAMRTQAPEQVKKIIDNDAAFMAEVQRVSDKFQIDAADLLAVMYRESQLDPQAVNPKSGATGLIQFMPETAKGLGTTTAALKTMTAAEQMKWVEKYLDSVGLRRGASRGEIYGYIFMPAKVNSGVLAVAGTMAYDWNKGLDINRDGLITIADLDVATGGDSGAMMLAAQTAEMASGRDLQLEASILDFFMKNSEKVETPVTETVSDKSTEDNGVVAANMVAEAVVPVLAKQQNQINNLTKEIYSLQSLNREDNVSVDNPALA